MLKNYNTHTTKGMKLIGTIKSGVKSGDSNAEMMIVEPLIQHPEIKGLYRAVDPDTGWKGWVEYTPPAPTPTPTAPPTPADQAREDYESKLRNLMTMKEELDLGVITQAEYDAYLQEVKDAKALL